MIGNILVASPFSGGSFGHRAWPSVPTQLRLMLAAVYDALCGQSGNSAYEPGISEPPLHQRQWGRPCAF